jgi:hypothetical protein
LQLSPRTKKVNDRGLLTDFSALGAPWAIEKRVAGGGSSAVRYGNPGFGARDITSLLLSA